MQQQDVHICEQHDKEEKHLQRQDTQPIGLCLVQPLVDNHTFMPSMLPLLPDLNHSLCLTFLPLYCPGTTMKYDVFIQLDVRPFGAEAKLRHGKENDEKAKERELRMKL